MVDVLDVSDVLAKRAAAVSNDVLLELLPIRNFNLNGAIQVVKINMFFNICWIDFFIFLVCLFCFCLVI